LNTERPIFRVQSQRLDSDEIFESRKEWFTVLLRKPLTIPEARCRDRSNRRHAQRGGAAGDQAHT